MTIILHVMTKDGWLTFDGPGGEIPQPEEFESGEVLNAQMVWRGKIGAGVI